MVEKTVNQTKQDNTINPNKHTINPYEWTTAGTDIHQQHFWDQKLIPYRYSPCSVLLLLNLVLAETTSSKMPFKVHGFKSDRDEIWHDYSSSQYPSSDKTEMAYFQDGSHDMIRRRMQQHPPAAR